MPLSSELQIVGFNGRPVKGGAGVKRPLLFDARRRRFALAPTAKQRPEEWWSERDVAESESRALLTRIGMRGLWTPGTAVLYAHWEFIAPTLPSAGLPPQLSLDGLRDFPVAESWVGTLAGNEAADRLVLWATKLLEHAGRALGSHWMGREERGRIALNDAMRARFCTTENAGAMFDLRKRAFAIAIAASCLAGDEARGERILEDAVLDFDPDQTAGVRSDAARLLSNARSLRSAAGFGFQDAPAGYRGVPHRRVAA